MGKHQTSKDSTSHRKHEINISRTDSEIRYDIVTGHWYRLSEGKNGKIKRKRYLTIVGFLVEEGDIEKYLEKEVRRVAKLTPQRYFLTQDTRRIVDEGRVSSFGLAVVPRVKEILKGLLRDSCKTQFDSLGADVRYMYKNPDNLARHLSDVLLYPDNNHER